MAYNLPTHIKGDTFDGVEFTLVLNSAPVDLTNAVIDMDVRKKVNPKSSSLLRISSTTGGIEIGTPATSGIFSIVPQIVDIAAGEYVYDIQIAFPDGEVKTYIAGDWTITQDITHG
jgi:hypothetical protein